MTIHKGRQGRQLNGGLQAQEDDNDNDKDDNNNNNNSSSNQDPRFGRRTLSRADLASNHNRPRPEFTERGQLSAKMTTKTSHININDAIALNLASVEQAEPLDHSRDPSLRNKDGGYAWFILGAVFLLNANVGGTGRVLGIIYSEQVRTGYYDRQQASWPIATASTVENLAGLLTPALASRLSWRQIELLSSLLFICSFLGAFLSNHLWTDIICVGLIQGLALSINTVLTLEINNNYFERFRTTAYGVIMSGSTCGVLYLAPAVSYILQIRPDDHRFAYLCIGSFYVLNVLLSLMIIPRASAPDLTSWCGRGDHPKQSLESTPGKGNQRAISRRVSARLERGLERKSSVASMSVDCKLKRQSTYNNLQQQRRQSQLSSQIGPVQVDPLGRKISRYSQWSIGSLISSPSLASHISQLEVPNSSNSNGTDSKESGTLKGTPGLADDNGAALTWPNVARLLKSPYLQCVWIMLALYFLVARILVIILFDFAHDHQLVAEDEDATALLNYWSVGELFGRIFLGCLIDLRWLPVRHCIWLTCSILGASLWLMVTMAEHYVIVAISLSLTASLVSLEYMLINVLMIEYIGRSRVTLAYSLGSLISSVVLAIRPTLIGLFRDTMGSYDGLLYLLAFISLGFGLSFGLCEPLMVRFWPKPDGEDDHGQEKPQQQQQQQQQSNQDIADGDPSCTGNAFTTITTATNGGSLKVATSARGTPSLDRKQRHDPARPD